MQYSKWVFLVVGAICIVMVAGFVGASHLYYMAAILLTLPVVSWFLGWLMLRKLQWRREPLQSGWESEEAEFGYVGRNPTPVPRYFLSVRDSLPPGIEAITPESALFNVPANGEMRTIQRVRFRKRGVYTLPTFEVSAIDPLGVFAFVRRVSYPGEIVVYPRIVGLPEFEISGAERHGAQEFTSQLLRGSSVDPDGVRQYAPGDPLRRIHWRQTARTGNLSVIEFEESQSRDLVIALDLERNRYGTLAPDDPDSLLEQAVRFVASSAQEALRQNAAVRLVLPDLETGRETDRIVFGAAAQSRHGAGFLYVLLTALARVEATAREPVREVITRQAANWAPGTTLLVVTANPDPMLPDVLRGYTALGISVMVVFVAPRGKTPGWALDANPESTSSPSRWMDALTSAGARVYRLYGISGGETASEGMTLEYAVAR